MTRNTSPSFSQAYGTRLTCFIDLLCFKRDVQQIETNPALLLSIDAVLRHIWKCKSDIDRKRSNAGSAADARMTSFSDCVVLSYVPTPGAAFRALWDAAFLGHVMLRAGYLPRGAITIGRMYHDDVVVYGGALVEATDLEKHTVITPRILVADSVMVLVREDLVLRGEDGQESDYVRPSEAGPHVHILGTQWSFLQKEREQEQAGELHGNGILQLFEELKAMLPERFRQAPDDRARQKLLWMRDYVNGALEEHKLPPHLRVNLP